MATRMLRRSALCIFSRTGQKTVNSYRSVRSGRSFCTGYGGTGDIPLSHPLPGLPKAEYAIINNHTYDTHVTTLDNGLKVASEKKFGQFCTVGVAIDSGARYESWFPSGIQHFLEKLAFSSTSQFDSRDVILQILEKHGGICDCQGSRDTLIYAMSAERRGLESMVELLSEVTLRPRITDEEIKESGVAIGFELESLNMRPDPEPLLMEMIHKAAYRHNTLGLPKICPEDSISLIDRRSIMTYLHNYHRPERMVLAGVGVDHDEMVEFAQKYFVDKKPIWVEETNVVDKSLTRDESLAQYTGGVYKEEKDLSNVSLGPSPMPELAHIVLGLESCSHKDDDFIAFCVLNMLMGGGGSFSAGGPGKGMFTRLYLNVLNRHHWIYNATAFNHAYNDSGLFCIHASCHPSMLKDLTSIIVQEMAAMTGQVSKSELSRAKTQLQSMLLMNLEARPVVFEDIARQVLACGFRRSPQWYYDRIGEITIEDIQRVASRMLRSKPAVAALGSLTHLPSYQHISKALLAKENNKISRKFSIFR